MGMRADIYRNDHGDCSNGGISSRCSAVTIVNVDGPFEPNDDAPAVTLTTRGGRPCLHPVDRPEGLLGPMMGGCYVASYEHGVLPLHDRYESQTQYDALSI